MITSRSKHQADPDVYVVGAGVHIPGHLTIEALEALNHCHRIYTILPPSAVTCFPKDLARRTESIWHLYESGKLREEIYNLEVATVIESALQKRPVAYVSPGNPVTFDSVTQGLLRNAEQHGLDVLIIPGISSIDTIFIDLQRDIAPGLQIYDASWLVACAIKLQVDIPCLLLQPSAFGTAYVTTGYELKRGALDPLRDYLLRFYPAEHEVAFVRSSVRRREQGQIYRVALQDLTTIRNHEVAGASLFISPLRELRPDPEFMAQMSDPASLSERYALDSLGRV